MPRRRLPYVMREVTRHGAVVWYVRKGRGKRIRLKSAYGTDEFFAEYQAALAGETPRLPNRLPVGTLAWLWDRYTDSLAFSQLRAATRTKKTNSMKRILARTPDARLLEITSAVIKEGIDARKDKPNVARDFLETLRSVFQWGLQAELVSADPTQGIETPRDTASKGFHVWTEKECQRFEARWPRGTWERRVFDVLLYTGLRRGDAVRVTQEHIKDGLIVMPTEKTGEVACIPILPPLAEALQYGPSDGVHLIVGKSGRPMTKESFGNLFRKACDEAGVPGAAHGLRKAMANRVAHMLTEAEMEAFFGWERGSRVTSIYTQQVVRERLAKSAAHKLKQP